MFSQSIYIKPQTLLNTVEIFLRGYKKVFLIKGSSGSGKTQFCNYFIGIKSQTYQITYIDLFDNKSCQHDISKIPSDENSLLLFDHYGDDGQFYNVCQRHHLQEWKGKIIVVCNAFHLINYQDWSNYFAPHKGELINHHLFDYAEITPLSREEANLLAQSHQKVDSSNVEKFFNHRFSENIIQHPLLLQMGLEVFCQYLPDETDYALQQCYLQLLEKLLRYHQNKYAINHHKDAFSQYLSLCNKLARLIESKQSSQFTYEPHSDLFDDEEDEWKPFFNTRQESMKPLQMSLPIFQKEKMTFCIWTPFLQTLFAKHEEKEIALTTVSQKQEFSLFAMKQFYNDILILKNLAILNFLSDRVYQEPQFKKFLIKVVLASKLHDGDPDAAAVAITILNHAKFSFCNLDLSDIKIPNAILDYGLFSGTLFVRAVLKGVSCKRSLINQAVFDDADMEGMTFGELPTIDIHESGINCIAISSDHQYMATLSKSKLDYPKQIVVWGTNTFTLLNYVTSKDPIIGMFFDPNNRELIYVTSTGEIIIVEHQTDKLMYALNSGLKRIDAMEFIPDKDQHLIALIGLDLEGNYKFRLYDYYCNIIDDISCFENSESEYYSADEPDIQIKVSPDGTKIAMCKHRIGMYLIDTRLKKIIKYIVHTGFDAGRVLAFLSHQKILVAASNSLLLYFNSETGNEVFLNSSPQQLSGVKLLAASQENPWIIINDSTGLLYVWDYIAKRVIDSYFNFEFINYLKIIKLNNVEVICAGEASGLIRFYEINPMRALNQSPLIHSPAVVLLPETHHVIAGGADGMLRYWDFRTGNCKATYQAHELDIQAILAITEKDYLVTAGAEGAIILWQLSSFTKKWQIQASSKQINVLLLSTERDKFFSAGDDGIMRLWHLESGEMLFDLAPDLGDKNISIHSLAFSACKKFLYSGDISGVLRRWNIEEKIIYKTIQAHGKCISTIAVEPNGNFLMTGSVDCNFHIYHNLDEAPAICDIHYGEVSYVSFTQDSQYAISAGHDGYIYLWSLHDGKIHTTLYGDTSGVMYVDYCKEGRNLLVSRWSGAIELWQLNGKTAILLYSVGHRLNATLVKHQKAKSISDLNKLLLNTLCGEENALNQLLFVHTSRYQKNANNLHDVISVMLKSLTNSYQRIKWCNPLENWQRNHPEIFFSRLRNNNDFGKSDNDEHISVMQRIIDSPDIDFKTNHVMKEWLTFYNQTSSVPKNLPVNDEEILQYKIAKLGLIVNHSYYSNQWIRTALKHGTDVNGLTGSKFSVLALPLAKKRLQVYQYLIKHGVNLSQITSSDVNVIIKVGTLQAMKILNDHHINLQSSENFNIILSRGDLETIQYFEQCFPDIIYTKFRNEKLPIIFSVVIRGHLNIVKYYVNIKKLDINVRNSLGGVPLTYACMHDSPEIALFLLDNGADPCFADDTAAPWISAVKNNHIDLIDKFSAHPQWNEIMKKPIPNEGSLLLLAVTNGYREISMLLFNRGHDALFNFENTSVFAQVILKNDLTLAKEIIENLPFVCNSDAKIFEILQKIVDRVQRNDDLRNNESMIYLISFVKNKNYVNQSTNETFLMKCASSGNLIATEMVFLDSIVNLRDSEGRTALFFSVFQHIDVVKYLLENNADPNLQDNRRLTPIHVAVEERSLSLVKLLYEFKADVNFQSDGGMTPLMRSARDGTIAIYQYLLHIANANYRLVHDQKKLSSLHLACNHGHFSIVRIHGEASLGLDLRGENNITLLHAVISATGIKSIKSSSIRVIEYLLDQVKIPINECMNNNITPIMLATKLDQVEHFECLYRRKADLISKDNHETSVFGTALKDKSINIAKFIVKQKEHKKTLKQIADHKLKILNGLYSPFYKESFKVAFDWCVNAFYVLCVVDRLNPSLPDSLRSLIKLLELSKHVKKAKKFKDYLDVVLKEQLSNSAQGLPSLSIFSGTSSETYHQQLDAIEDNRLIAVPSQGPTA